MRILTAITKATMSIAIWGIFMGQFNGRKTPKKQSVCEAERFRPSSGTPLPQHRNISH